MYHQEDNSFDLPFPPMNSLIYSKQPLILHSMIYNISVSQLLKFLIIKVTFKKGRYCKILLIIITQIVLKATIPSKHSYLMSVRNLGANPCISGTFAASTVQM